MRLRVCTAPTACSTCAIASYSLTAICHQWHHYRLHLPYHYCFTSGNLLTCRALALLAHRCLPPKTPHNATHRAGLHGWLEGACLRARVRELVLLGVSVSCNDAASIGAHMCVAPCPGSAWARCSSVSWVSLGDEELGTRVSLIAAVSSSST